MSFAEIKCRECGDTFTPKVHNQVFCKKEHYRKCTDCGDEFLALKIKDNPLKCGSRGRCSKFVSKETLKKQASKSSKAPCSECSIEFTPARSTQKVCPNEHERVCVICGDLFAPGRAKLSKDPKVCTPSCGAAFSHLSKDDPRRTANNRVTVTTSGEKIFDSFSKPNLKKCLVCSKEFNAIRSRQKTCSKECGDKIAQTSREETFLSKYGVSNPMFLDSSKENLKKTSLEKYGTEHPAQSEKVKERIVETNLKKYGKKSYLATKESRDRYSEVMLEKYGVKYGMESKEIRERLRANLLEKYGVDHIMKVPGHKDYLSQKMKEKYGVDNPSLRGVKNLEDWTNFEAYLKSLDSKPTTRELAEYFNVGSSAISGKISKNESLRELISFVSSYKEDLFEKFILNTFKDTPIKYEKNNRSVISPKELDFYFPEHKLAVEVSPTATHNSLEVIYKGEPKDKNYHLSKFLACEEQGIELITIFDWMPWDKTLEMISHKLSGTSNKVGANKTRSFTVSRDSSQKSKELKDFIAENHVLGFSNTRGTEYFSYLESKGSGEILAVAAWGAPSSFRNKSKSSAQENETTETKEGVSIELKRLVFRKGYSIPGGASKLLKSFERTFEELSGKKLSSVFTFSDCDLGTGKIYETLGFSLVEAPKPGLNFVSPIFDQPSSPGTAWRIKANSLALQGADRLLRNLPGYTPVGLVCPHLLEGSSESSEGTSTENTSTEVKREHPNGECLPSNQDIVRAYGFFDVYDCGYKKWQKAY